MATFLSDLFKARRERDLYKEAFKLAEFSRDLALEALIDFHAFVVRELDPDAYDMKIEHYLGWPNDKLAALRALLDLYTDCADAEILQIVPFREVK